MNKLTVEEFENVIDKYQDMLLKIAYSYTKNTFDSEDIVQDVFVKFYRARKTFDSEEHIKNWLIRVTINRSIDYIKRNKRILSDDEYINNLPDTLESRDDEEIYNLVSSLRKDYRVIITLFYYDDYSIKDIASILNIKENNVKVRLNRARCKLKELLEERNKNGKR